MAESNHDDIEREQPVTNRQAAAELLTSVITALDNDANPWALGQGIEEALTAAWERGWEAGYSKAEAVSRLSLVPETRDVLGPPTLMPPPTQIPPPPPLATPPSDEKTDDEPTVTPSPRNPFPMPSDRWILESWPQKRMRTQTGRPVREALVDWINSTQRYTTHGLLKFAASVWGPLRRWEVEAIVRSRLYSLLLKGMADGRYPDDERLRNQVNALLGDGWRQRYESLTARRRALRPKRISVKNPKPAPVPAPSSWVTVRELAAALSRPVQTIHNWTASEVIPPADVRIEERDLGGFTRKVKVINSRQIEILKARKA